MSLSRHLRFSGITGFIKANSFFVILILLAISGLLTILYTTHWAPWVYGDSTAYIDTSRNCIAGHGFGHQTASGEFEYTVGHPPLYQLVLCAFGRIGIDVMDTARWLNAILFSGTIFVVGALIFSFGQSAWLSIVISLTVLTSSTLINVYSGAMTESLFLFFGFTGILMTMLYSKKRRRIILFAAAIASGLSFLARYPGFAFVFTGVIISLIHRQFGWKRKLFDTFLYVIIAIAPMTIWLTWLYLNPLIGPVRRSSDFLSDIWTTLIPFRLGLVEVVWGWVPGTAYLPALSYNHKLIVLVGFVLVFLTVIVFMFRKNSKEGYISENTARLLHLACVNIIFIGVYLILIGSAYLVGLDKPDIIDRTLSPLFISTVIVGFTVLEFIRQTWISSKPIRAMSIVLVTFFIFSSIVPSVKYMNAMHMNGLGYSSKAWGASATIQSLRGLPENLPIITNETSAVRFLLNRAAYPFPDVSDRSLAEGTARFGDNPNNEVERVFSQEGAALVLFNSLRWQLYPIFADETEDYINALTKELNIYAQSYDGAIYLFPSNGD